MQPANSYMIIAQQKKHTQNDISNEKLFEKCG